MPTARKTTKKAKVAKPEFKRIVLKLSGEALQGGMGSGIDPKTVSKIAKEVQEIHAMGLEIALVVGGGNIVRGMHTSKATGMERATADYMGMMATVINAMALQHALEQFKVPTRVQTAIEVQRIAEPYIRRRAMRHLEKGRVVIFAAGTGNPFFTTDTTAALRAMEIGAEVVLKGTQVDGVYDADPATHPKAKRYTVLKHMQLLKGGLKVMDATAVSLCMEGDMPIIVFNLGKAGNIRKAVLGERVGTRVISD